MRRPEGIRFGKHSIFGDMNPALFLTVEQRAEVSSRHPELARLMAGTASIPSVRATAAALFLLDRKAPRRPFPPDPAVRLPSPMDGEKRRLPLFDHEAGQRVCSTCSSPCCTILAAGLTSTEASSGRYQAEGPDEHGSYYLPRPYNRCIYLTKDNLCEIYEDRPLVCRSYRCDSSGAEDDRVNRWLLREYVAEVR